MSDSTLQGYERAILRTIDNSGNIINESYFSPGSDNHAFRSVELTNDGGFILCGYAKYGLTKAYIVKTDSNGNVKPVGIINNNSLISDFELLQNYPNPFNPKTVISYSIIQNSNVILKVFDLLGKEVAILVNQKQSAGSYSVDFVGANLSSGIYFYKLESESANGQKFVSTKRMLLLK